MDLAVSIDPSLIPGHVRRTFRDRVLRPEDPVPLQRSCVMIRRSRKAGTIKEGLVNKKSYEKPAVVHTEKLEARAISCAKENDANCAAGPVQS